MSGFDCILGNPPFLNQVESATTVAKAAAEVSRLLTGEASVRYTDVSATFLLLAAQKLRDQGYAALVQPQSLLSAKAAGPVRKSVLLMCALRALWVSNEHVFDASVFTCAPTIQRGGPRRATCGRATGKAIRALDVVEIDNDELASATRWLHVASRASSSLSISTTSSARIALPVARPQVARLGPPR